MNARRRHIAGRISGLVGGKHGGHKFGMRLFGNNIEKGWEAACRTEDELIVW